MILKIILNFTSLEMCKNVNLDSSIYTRTVRLILYITGNFGSGQFSVTEVTQHCESKQKKW
jgi:hypothetical protein